MASLDQKTILVVDDESMVSEMLARFLKREGFQAAVAKDFETTLAALTQAKIDAVLLDIGLGDEDGFDLLKKIRELHPSVPVVMLTGLGYDDKAMEEALELGAAGYLSKTDDVSEVGVTIRRVLCA